MSEEQQKPKTETINQISQSIASNEFYFVKRGIRKVVPETGFHYIEAKGDKIDITKQIHRIILDILFRFQPELVKVCIFCGQPKTHEQKINQKGSDYKIAIPLCNRCEVKV